jgi:Peptidase family S41/N-terminal domain of Peptidase_S41 in eukaryotic IRBP
MASIAVTGGGVDQAELRRLEHMIDSEMKLRFPAEAVRRATVLQPGDDAEELLVRVVVAVPDGSQDPRRSLEAWAQAHEAAMKRVRRELSLRLPEARLLEFTVEDVGDPDTAPRITMPDDPALTSAPLSAREIVETTLALLRRNYVFPDRAEQAATTIEARLAAGEYDDLDETALAERLTSQLDEICADKHLRVRAMPPRPPRPGRAGPGPGRPAREHLGAPGGPDLPGHPLNYGIYRVERLDGNVGYIDLHGVAPPEEAGPAITAAMELVKGTYALIIDLRRNHGGSPHGVAFWCSYLFPGADTHLGDIYRTDTGETTQFWSLAYVPGTRYLDRPVYLLTSHETFSGGEDLCYTLQVQGRAQVIGETTGGGAHPTRMIPISETMAVSVPFARSVNPVTGTNWQGTGVVPDTAVPADEAYEVAYGRALRHVLSITVPPPVADEARAALAGLPTPLARDTRPQG